MSYKSFGGGGPLAVGVASALMGLATILLALRAYTGSQLARRTGWDLLWVLIAYLLGLLAEIFLVLSTRYGIGNHLAEIDPTHIGVGFLYNWIFNICTILSTGFGKLAILDILLHIEGPTNNTRRWVLYFVGASTMLLNVNQSIIVWFQCEPRDKLWNVLTPGTCDAQYLILSLGVFQGSWSAACDFFLAFYPALIFWKLQVSWQRRLGLIALFAGGSVAGAAAAIKTSYILTLLASSDITYAILPLVLWAETEMWLIIIMGTIPTLRPLFIKLFRSISSIKHSRMSKGSGALNAGGSGSKEVHSRSMPLRPIPGSKPNGNNRISQKIVGGSESEEDILPKGGNGIVVKSDYDVAYAERAYFPTENLQQASSQAIGPGSH